MPMWRISQVVKEGVVMSNDVHKKMQKIFSVVVENFLRDDDSDKNSFVERGNKVFACCGEITVVLTKPVGGDKSKISIYQGDLISVVMSRPEGAELVFKLEVMNDGEVVTSSNFVTKIGNDGNLFGVIATIFSEISED